MGHHFNFIIKLEELWPLLAKDDKVKKRLFNFYNKIINIFLIFSRAHINRILFSSLSGNIVFS